MPPLSPEFWIWAVAIVGLASTASALRFAHLQNQGRRKLKRALAKRIRQTRVRDRIRNQFLAAVSHDLRQPLQAAGMFAEVLSTRLLDTPHTPVVERLVQSIDSTNTLLSSLIDVTTMDMGVVEVHPTIINLSGFLEQLFRQVEIRAVHKSLRFLFHPKDCAVVSDPLLLERLVRNLLINAITYTESGGVLLGCRYRPNQVGIQVVDTGIGIPEDHLGQIFEDFIRLAPKTPDGNLGLGLSVVRRTAQLLGHRIEVKSRLGKGSIFTVWVDLA